MIFSYHTDGRFKGEKPSEARGKEELDKDHSVPISWDIEEVGPASAIKLRLTPVITLHDPTPRQLQNPIN